MRRRTCWTMLVAAALPLIPLLPSPASAGTPPEPAGNTRLTTWRVFEDGVAFSNDQNAGISTTRTTGSEDGWEEISIGSSSSTGMVWVVLVTFPDLVITGSTELHDFDTGAANIKTQPLLRMNGRPCYEATGTIDVLELERDLAGDISRLSANLSVDCANGTEHDELVIRHHALPAFDAIDPAVGQFAGENRIDTAAWIAEDRFWDRDPQTVLLARSDDYADALAGAPLAVKYDAPLLLTPKDQLDEETLAEIEGFLPEGSMVVLLGGPGALSPDIEAELEDYGYQTRRIAGADRFATAVAIAGQLGNPQEVLLVTGRNFPDGLSAGAAAAARGAAVLLTDGPSMPAATAAYLAAHPTVAITAIGGPAASASPSSPKIVGADRYETSALIAQQLFPAGLGAAGLASGENFPDALAGGTHVGALGGPLLLTRRTQLPAAVRDVIQTWVHDALFLYGGNAAISDDLDPLA